MRFLTVCAASLGVFAAGSALAQGTGSISLSGHAWETGGFPPSQSGDELQAVGIVNDIDELSWNSATNSYTWYVRQLSSLGEVVANGVRTTNYTGGLITIYEDGLPSDHDYGINPPNATSPSTFSNGSIYLDGTFALFQGTYDDGTMQGSFYGEVLFSGGTAFSELNGTDGWYFGVQMGGVSPAGYDLQVNGDVAVETVAVEPSTWGGVKALYR